MIKQPDPRLVSKVYCHKLECLEDFLKSFASGGSAQGYCYLELFAKPGEYRCKESGAIVKDLSHRALRIKPGFGRYVFAVPSADHPAEFSGIDALVISGNILYDSTRRQIFDQIPRSSDILCIIDPSGYSRLRWSTMKKIITGGTNWQGYRMDMLFIFPLENALFKNISRLNCRYSLTVFLAPMDGREPPKTWPKARYPHLKHG